MLMAMVEIQEEDGQSQTKADLEAPLIRIVEMEGRGRATVANQPLRAGQIILRDSPILIYSAFPLMMMLPFPPQQQQQEDSEKHYYYCSNCFRILQPSNPTIVSCLSCSASASMSPGHTAATLFCGPSCRSIALSSSHTPWVCQALSHLRNCPSPLLHHYHQDRQVQARFLIAAYNLAVVSPSDFQTLLCLQGEGYSPAHHLDDAAFFLHSLISSVCPPLPNSVGFGFSLELTAALLAKDKLNAFGLMEPFTEAKERSVRAYGIYPRASFFNHDCLPNACRFDYVDISANHNTDIIVRVIHNVPQGREICLSYFPVNLKYSERQQRLREDYGFTCECDRCKVEVNWSDEEEEEEEESNDGSNKEEEEAMDEDSNEHIVDKLTEDCGGVKGDNDFPHAYFFLRYMCNRSNCWGTLAPLPPSDSDAAPSTVMECNVCGNLKRYEEMIESDALD